jgi:hypothetical protein
LDSRQLARDLCGVLTTAPSRSRGWSRRNRRSAPLQRPGSSPFRSGWVYSGRRPAIPSGIHSMSGFGRTPRTRTLSPLAISLTLRANRRSCRRSRNQPQLSTRPAQALALVQLDGEVVGTDPSVFLSTCLTMVCNANAAPAVIANAEAGNTAVPKIFSM